MLLPSMDALALADTLYGMSSLKASPGPSVLAAASQRMLQLIDTSVNAGLPDPEALVLMVVALAR